MYICTYLFLFTYLNTKSHIYLSSVHTEIEEYKHLQSSLVLLVWGLFVLLSIHPEPHFYSSLVLLLQAMLDEMAAFCRTFHLPRAWHRNNYLSLWSITWLLTRNAQDVWRAKFGAGAVLCWDAGWAFLHCLQTYKDRQRGIKRHTRTLSMNISHSLSNTSLTHTTRIILSLCSPGS